MEKKKEIEKHNRLIISCYFFFCENKRKKENNNQVAFNWLVMFNIQNKIEIGIKPLNCHNFWHKII